MKTLIVASYPQELKPLIALGRRHFVIKGDTGYLAAGIGPVAAAFGLTHFLEDFQPKKILALGTAGIIRSQKLRIGDLVVARSVSSDGNFSDTYVPKAIPVLQCSRKPSEYQYGPLPLVSVFTPQEITKTESRRLELENAHLDVENLEAYAYAFVAKKFRIPCTIVLGLTNHVGPGAHKEWRKNEKRVVGKLFSQINVYL